MDSNTQPATQQPQGRALPAVIKERKNALIAAMEESRPVIETLLPAQQDKFRQNMMDFAFQDYLMQIIQPRDIIEFAVKITRLGLDISPTAKECYIVPFDTKVQGQKVMLPQAIIPLNGIQQQAYQKGFQLMIYSVYELGDEVVSEFNMPLKYMRQLNTANEKWVNDHFLGFEVVLTDLTNEIPEQRKLVEVAYVREVTKTVQDKRFQIQNWIHKACRRAFREFLIPSSRKVDIFEQVENLNDQILANNKADTDIRPEKNFEEIQAGLAPLGITLSYSNGMAIASGNTHTNAKSLQQLGFTFTGNNYSIETTAPVTDVKPEPNPNVLNPEIETILQSVGLDISVLDGYVKVTGNTQGLEELLGEIGIKETKKGWVGVVANLKVPQQATPFD